MRVGEGEAQVLRDKLDVHQAALDELQVPRVPVAFLVSDQRAHLAHLAGDPCRVALAQEGLAHGLRDFVGKAGVAGDDSGAGQRHVLPGLRLVALVEDEGGELGRERTLAARGPEPHVDFIERPRRVGAVSAASRRWVKRE